MTAWGVVAVCGIGGGAAGPFLDSFAAEGQTPCVASTVAPVASVTDGAALATLQADAPSPEELVGEPPADLQPRSHRAVAAQGATAGVVTGALCALAAVRLGALPQLGAYCILTGALVVVSDTDLRTGLVPRRVVYASSALVGLALLSASAADGTWRPMVDACAGGAIAFLVLGAVWWVSPKAMGFGDVRLAGLCGGALGWLGFAPVYLGFLAAFVAGAVVGLGVLAVRGRRRFPFAPALALGTMFGVLWGGWLGHVWLHG